jgi:tRNA G46 methylase TrmB
MPGFQEKEEEDSTTDAAIPVDACAMEEEVHVGNNSRKKRKVVFPYGNYHRYYGYRVGKTLKQDPRMELMQTQWFQDKDVLDIGCNEGHVTIALAQKYHVQSMCGVDIDSASVNRTDFQGRQESTNRVWSSRC